MDGDKQECVATETAAEETVQPKRKIAIIGTAPSSIKLAPYDNPAWEIWVLKVFGVPRWDVFFEIHEPVAGEQRWPKEYVAFLRSEHRRPPSPENPEGELKPIFAQSKVKEWPNSEPYPLQWVMEQHGAVMGGKRECRYFTNQVSYMLALAVLQPHVTDIGLWGIDMAQHSVGGKSEYAHQRPSCEYFLGVAAGRGINVHIPPQSDLLKARCLYGFETDDWGDKVKARSKELSGRVLDAESKMLAARDKMNMLRGALEQNMWNEQWLPSGSYSPNPELSCDS